MPSREVEARFLEAAMSAIVTAVRAASVRLEDAEDAAQIAALALLVWLRRQPEDGPMPEAAAPFVQRVASIACALVARDRGRLPRVAALDLDAAPRPQASEVEDESSRRLRDALATLDEALRPHLTERQREAYDLVRSGRSFSEAAAACGRRGDEIERILLQEIPKKALRWLGNDSRFQEVWGPADRERQRQEEEKLRREKRRSGEAEKRRSGEAEKSLPSRLTDDACITICPVDQAAAYPLVGLLPWPRRSAVGVATAAVG